MLSCKLFFQLFQATFQRDNFFPHSGNIGIICTVQRIEQYRLCGVQFFQLFGQFCNATGQSEPIFAETFHVHFLACPSLPMWDRGSAVDRIWFHRNGYIFSLPFVSVDFGRFRRLYASDTLCTRKRHAPCRTKDTEVYTAIFCPNWYDFQQTIAKWALRNAAGCFPAALVVLYSLLRILQLILKRQIQPPNGITNADTLFRFHLIQGKGLTFMQNRIILCKYDFVLMGWFREQRFWQIKTA